jgi:predicted RNA polymerase sigma factor
VRDIGVAEDLAHDALVAALEQWPESGVPNNPGAWLMATGKHRAIDYFRRNKRVEQKHVELGHQLEASRRGLCRISTPALDDDNRRTTCCGSSSRRAIPCCRPKRASRSRCAWSAA